MKREEKNQQTRRKILNYAIAEFSKHGYGASSVNEICANEDISKGIIYHYFKTKDDLYLTCVEECFTMLTDYLKTHFKLTNASAHEQLENYFNIRMDFFHEFPIYQPIFCEAVINPPQSLKSQIHDKKRTFDQLNAEILSNLLKNVPLNPNISKEDVVDTFRHYQDFINAKYQMIDINQDEFEQRDEYCKKALYILLYGIIERKESFDDKSSE